MNEAGHPAGAYGRSIGATFRADSFASLTSRIGDRTFAVTRVRRSVPIRERTIPLVAEEAFHFGFQLVDRGAVELFTENRLAFKGHMRAGTLSMIDIACRPSSCADGPQDALLFYVPRSVLDAVAVEREGGPITELLYAPGISVVDPVVFHLAQALLEPLASPERVSPLFFDHVALAFQEHVVQTYGRLRRPLQQTKGGLAPWQERRAKELLASNLDGRLPLERLASECRLSRSHFVKGFKQATGLPPHRWLTLRRLEAAKSMLLRSDAALGEIASACGFANHSHFSRVFASLVGESPRDFRRRHRRPSV